MRNRNVTFLVMVFLFAIPNSAFAGSIAAWGSNQDGNLDTPDGNDFVDIDGGLHSVALKSDGSIVAWGLNDDSQCDVPVGNDFVDIAMGRYHSLAIKVDGSLVAWGYGEYGQMRCARW